MAANINLAIVTGGARRVADAIIQDLAEFRSTGRFFVENRSITGQMVGLDGGQHLSWEAPDTAEFDE